MKSVYRGMTRAQLDVAYDNPGAVDDFPAVYAAMRARSAALYARLAGQGASERDLHYGPAPQQRYDYLACGHHATERYGAPALAAHVAARFGIGHEFIDIDNPA